MTKFSGDPDVGAWTDSSTKTQWKGNASEINFGTTSGQCRITEIVVTYTASGGTSDLEDSDFALTGAPVALSFDLYNNADAQTISYTSSSTGAVTVATSEYVEAVVNETAKTITVTPKKKSSEAQTITVSQAADNTYKAGSATFKVTIADSTPTTGAWVLTDLADLVEGDVFVIVGDNGDTYAMSNDKGTGSAPTAVAVTVEDDEISGTVGDNIKWNISGNANDGYTFYPNGSTETWLYCTNSNNGVRVGTGDAKHFTLTTGTNPGYLTTTETNDQRYIGIFSSQDWRCYTSINANIKDQTFAFYKYMDDATVKAPVITVDETFVGSTTATITCATEGATIYYSFNGEDWTEYTDALTITETTTIYAKAVMGEDESAVVQKTTTKTLPTPQINIDDSGITNNDVYVGTAAGSLVANIFFNNAAIEGATVTWSGNNDEVATINATTGAVTLVAAGNVTFTATFAGNDEYNGATATYEMTVFNNDPNAPGTENNPYTVAQAMAATPTTGDVYIRGIVSSFYKDNIVGDGTNYRYYISDDGATTTQLLVYKGKGMNNVAFSDADDLLVGDEVVICGKLTMYQNAPEVASGNYLVSWNRPVNTTPTITVSSAEVNVDADEHDGTLDLTYENLTISSMDDFGILFYDAEGEILDDPDWIYVLVAEQDPQVGEGYVVSYSMFANEGAARTAYFKVYALDDEGNVVYSDLITITQAAYVAPEETIGTFVKVTSTDDITSGQYLIVYEEGSVAFDGSLETLDAVSNTIDVVLNNGTIAATTTNAQSVFNIDVTAGTLQSASGYYIGVASNDNGLKTSEDAEAYTNSFSIDENGDAVIAAVFEGSTMTLRYNSASNQERFRYYKSGQKAIQLYKFVADADDVEVTVTSAGYATYCSEKALDFSDTGLTAYKAILDGSEVSFTEVKQVPAGEGVLLKGDAGTYSVPVAASAAALTGNAFIGVIEETLISEPDIFVLMNEDYGVGFYKTTKPFTVGAHTAYLPALAGGSRSFIGLNETTGIKDVNRETITNNRYFDLQGRRVAQPTKGLYIVNGKKVVVK